MTNRSLILAVVMALVGTGLAAPRAQAGYVVTLEQDGNDVVATGSGAIDLTGLTFAVNNEPLAHVIPNLAEIITGPLSGAATTGYSGFTGPASFGSGGQVFANSGSGDQVGIAGFDGFLFVPAGYVSDGALSDISSYSGQSLSSLGVTPGTYEWTWGTGPNQNFTLKAEAVGAPEPGSMGLLVLGLLGSVGFAGRKRRN